MINITAPDYSAMQRRRINADPRLSLQVYRELKDQDVFEFGVTVEQLAEELLRRRLAQRAG